MIYIKRFTKHEDYESYIASSGYVCPNVSFCNDVENEVHYNPCPPPPHDYSQDYLTFIPEEDCTFNFSGYTTANTLSYSIDNGETWTSLERNVDTPTITSGVPVLWKGMCTPNSNGIGIFSSTGRFTVEGNVMSLLYGDEYIGETSLSEKAYAFYCLFCRCTGITSAEHMSLPATTLAHNCYQSMFTSCTSLTTAPALPATTLDFGCYRNMFYNCMSLTTAPELPATTLAEGCYQNMFYNCKSLINAPSILPASTMDASAYTSMFQGCTSLVTAPELPATTLSSSCYYCMFQDCTNLTTPPSRIPATTMAVSAFTSMFSGCTSLATAPELPATTLANYCYRYMFQGCTSLTTAPELPATTLYSGCYQQMFQHCENLTTAPELPATTLVYRCYSGMFQQCNKLNYIKALFTTTPGSDNTSYWVNGVASSGTFVKNSAATWSVTGKSGIPNGWTVETASA